MDKVLGTARYTADIPIADVLHAVIVGSARPKARIVRFDLTAASVSPGLVRIFTHHNTPKLGTVSSVFAGYAEQPLQDDRVMYEGQPVALVVADTLEWATEAARLVKITYIDESFEADFAANMNRAEVAPLAFGLVPADSGIGDVTAAWRDAKVRCKRTYHTANRHASPIELSATLAVWQNGELLVHDSTQSVADDRSALAEAHQLDATKVRVKNEFIGGGFGAKGWGWPHQTLAAMASRELGRPVKLVLTRAQSYTVVAHQPATQQTVALSAKPDGTLTGIRHDSIAAGAFAGNYVEAPGWETHQLYSSPNSSTTHRLVRLDRGNPAPMRSPNGGIGLVAVEIAMDELAYKIGMDPLELRLSNYAESDPTTGLAFSSKKLRECYEVGASRFGWAKRAAVPRAMRDGTDLVGCGMATAILRNFGLPTNARVSMDRAGQVLIETSTHEIGQGASTVLPQIAADVLGVPVESVALALGDTALPVAAMSVGSSSAMSAGSAVQDGAAKLRRTLEQAGAQTPAEYPEALAALNLERLSCDGQWAPGVPSAALFSFGAVFAEVRVDIDIPIPRVSRVVGVYNAGRILNPTTANSQVSGGVIWGIGQALLEGSDVDSRLGRIMSKNLAGYLVPVNADVPQIDTSFVEDFDPHAGLVGARGIGELGAIGIGAAIANAVFHATGTRVREIPIRPEHLMADNGPQAATAERVRR